MPDSRPDIVSSADTPPRNDYQGGYGGLILSYPYNGSQMISFSIGADMYNKKKINEFYCKASTIYSFSN